jgi:hypothetical protein
MLTLEDPVEIRKKSVIEQDEGAEEVELAPKGETMTDLKLTERLELI